MLELCRIYRARQPMYRQERMEEEQQQQQQILTKLGELPIVSDTYAQVLGLYERTKGHNFVFRNTLGLAEYTAKAVAGRTVPILYNGLQTPIDKVNDIACNQLEALEEKYPIITKPTEEVWREGQEQYSKVKPYVDPLIKPAKMAVDVGKTAVNVGTTVATTAIKPAVYAVNMGSAVTSSVIDTGKHAVRRVASGMLSQTQRAMDVGLSTPLGQFWLQQFDSALEATEKLVLHHYLPLSDREGDEREEKREEAETRKERVCALVKHIHIALHHKAEGDIVRYRMIAGNLMHEIMELTGFYLTLAKDTSTTAWRDRQDILDAFDRVWNKYAQYIPEAARPEDPMKRMVMVLGTLTAKVGELFASSSELMKLVNQQLNDKCQEFVHWCQQSRAHLKEEGDDLKERYDDYMSQLTSYIPHIMEMVQFLTDKILDSIDVLGIASKWRRQKVAEIPLEKNEEIEMNDLQ